MKTKDENKAVKEEKTENKEKEEKTDQMSHEAPEGSIISTVTKFDIHFIPYILT